MSNTSAAAASHPQPLTTSDLTNSMHDILSWALDHMIANSNPESLQNWFNRETDRWDGFLASGNNNPALAWQAARSALGKDICTALLMAFPLLNRDAQRHLVTRVAQRLQREQAVENVAMQS